MLQIDFGLYRPMRHAFMHMPDFGWQGSMAILRHLRCDVNIGGEHYTYAMYIYRPIGRTRAGLATPTGCPILLPSLCDETVALALRLRSSALRASSGSNGPLEPLEAPRAALRGLFGHPCQAPAQASGTGDRASEAMPLEANDRLLEASA